MSARLPRAGGEAEVRAVPSRAGRWWSDFPYHWEADLSFSPHGTNGAGGGSVSASAGNSTLMDCMDSDVIVLRNDTCEDDFYVRVVVWAVPEGKTGDHSCTE